MYDDWRIEGKKDHVDARGKTMDQIMEQITIDAIDEFDSPCFFQREDIGQAVQIFPCTSRISRKGRNPEKPIRKTILKRVSIGGGSNETKAESLKKVTFDVEKFAADECGDAEERSEARARLAIRLGARPKKNRYVNYKQLKEELNMRKNSEAEFDKLSALKALKKLSMKKKVKGKKLSMKKKMKGKKIR